MGIEQLEPFIGEWELEAVFPNGGPTGGGATCSFEWLLGGKFVAQRTTVPHPKGPDGFMVISANADGGSFTQHYFDERGVVRVYAMTFEDGAWELLRVTPDFTPLDFSQRYTGRFSDDGRRIEGKWESSDDAGETWALDFQLNYAKPA
jgi:hypothetical protein